MKKCYKCGTELHEQAVYCPVCGCRQRVEGGGGPASGGNPETTGAVHADQKGVHDHTRKEKTEEDIHPEGNNDVMIGILSYITMIGWIVAFVVSSQDKEGRSRYAVFHLNQGLVLWLFAFLGLIPVIGIVWRIVILIFSIIAFIGACQSQAKKVPLLGNIHILKK